MKATEILGTVSAAANKTSIYYGLGDLTGYAIQVIFSGGGSDLVGTLTLESSCDMTQPPTEFTTITGTSQAVTASAKHTWNVSGAQYPYVRAKWVFTSGTGNITMNITAKENVIKGA